MSTTLRAGNLTAVVDPLIGSRVTSLRINDTEVLVTHGSSSLEWGLYPMAPFAGRLRRGQLQFDDTTYQLPTNNPPHALHGTVFDAPWRIDSVSDTDIALSTSLGTTWPFSGIVRHHISVSPTHLRCALSVTGEERMPIQLGWHPWFATPDEVKWDFTSMLRRDADGITTTERIDPAPPPVDDCFIEPNAWPRVHSSGHAWEIASDCPYWVRYDAPDSHVCIEPQSGPPNGLNTVPLILEAGQVFSRWMEIRLVPRQ
jgi:aldose 1-epimerase